MSTDWRERYRDKLRTAREAVARVESGQRVLTSVATTEPRYLIAALCERWRELRDVDVFCSNTMQPYPWFDAERGDAFRLHANYLSGHLRPLYKERRLDYDITTVYSPAKWREPGRESGLLEADVLLLMVSPPDADGYCSFGEQLWYSPTWVERAKCVIAEVNPLLIRTGGDNRVHVSKLDYLVEEPEPIPPFGLTLAVTPDEQAAAETIGALAASLVRDGDTIQIGVGSVSMAAGLYLRDKNDLGVHSEILTSSMIDLFKRGVITGARKRIDVGKMVAAGMFLEPDDYAFVNDNPRVELREAFYTNDPTVIARNPNQVAINNGLAMDLTGQLTVEAFGAQMYTGVAGQIDFVLGAYLSPGGRSITVMPSTARAGSVSRIVPMFPEGQVVSVPRTFVDYVVTEHGIASLSGASERVRAERLIEIAHPDFRDELRAACRQRFGR